MHNSPAPTPLPTAGLARRLAALCYDALLLLALLFVATLPWVLFARGEPLDPLAHVAYRGYLIGVSGLFFGWFWTHGGQTLGMRAWRLRLTGNDGGAVKPRAAAIRFAVGLASLGLLGLGFWWALFGTRRTWHDRAANTRVELLPKPARR